MKFDQDKKKSSIEEARASLVLVEVRANDLFRDLFRNFTRVDLVKPGVRNTKERNDRATDWIPDNESGCPNRSLLFQSASPEHCGHYPHPPARGQGANCSHGPKFGALPEAVRPLLEAAREFGLKVAGVSFHIGSGATRPGPMPTAESYGQHGGCSIWPSSWAWPPWLSSTLEDASLQTASRTLRWPSERPCKTSSLPTRTPSLWWPSRANTSRRRRSHWRPTS